jgi:fumarylacetoacetase
MKSFVDYSSNSDFSIHNIPFGVAVFNKEYIGCCTRIGDQVIDLATYMILAILKILKA